MKTTILRGLMAIILLSAASNNPNNSIPPTQVITQCSEGGYATANVTSKEEMNQSGLFTFDITIIASDTIWIDSLSFHGDNYFTLTVGGVSGVSSFASSPAFSQLYLLSEQQATATIIANYNAAQLPYYPKDLNMQIWVHNMDDNIDAAAVEVKVYFTQCYLANPFAWLNYESQREVWLNSKKKT